MRVVTIPEKVTIELPRKAGNVIEFYKEDRTLVRFLQECFDAFDTFSKGHVNALLYKKLTEILRDSDPEKRELWFEDEDFKKVEAAVGAVVWLTPKMNMAFIPFYEAVKTARTETLTGDKPSK
jgi:hypothetical protein